jgi:hypothetical protein
LFCRMSLFTAKLPAESHDSLTRFRERSFVFPKPPIRTPNPLINLNYRPVSYLSPLPIEFDRLRRTISMPSHTPLAPKTFSRRSIPSSPGRKANY